MSDRETGSVFGALVVALFGGLVLGALRDRSLAKDKPPPLPNPPKPEPVRSPIKPYRQFE